MAFYVRLDPSVTSPGANRNSEKPETIISVKLLVNTLFKIYIIKTRATFKVHRNYIHLFVYTLSLVNLYTGILKVN